MEQTKTMKSNRNIFSANIREIGLIAVIMLISLLVQFRSGGSFLTGENINNILEIGRASCRERV